MPEAIVVFATLMILWTHSFNKGEKHTPDPEPTPEQELVEAIAKVLKERRSK